MYFGSTRNGAGNIVRLLTSRVEAFSNAINSLRSSGSTLTQSDFQSLRDQYNAILPTRQDTFNVIQGTLPEDVSLPPGSPDPIVAAHPKVELRVGV